MSRDEATRDEPVATRIWDSRLLLRLLAWCRPHRWSFLGSFLILAGVFAVQLAGPYVWRLALDGPVRSVVGAGEAVDLPAELDRLYGLVGIYLGLVVLHGFLAYFEVTQLVRTGHRVVHDLRSKLFRHIEGLDVGFFDARPTGSLVTRVTGDLDNLNELFASGLITGLFDLFKIVAVVVAIFLVDPELAAIVTALTPVLIGVSLAFRGGARRAFRLVRAHAATLNGYLQEVLSGIRVVQLFRGERRVSARYSGLLEHYLRANLRTLILFSCFFPAISLTVFAIQGVALRLGGAELATGELEFGRFYQFWIYLALLVSPIRALGERYNVFQSALASAERIFQILDTHSKVAAPTDARELPGSPVPGLAVRFENVSFSYVEGTEVLRDVSFEIDAGETVAIVGATGAGKSTIVNLLLRFFDPDSGRITIDGVDLRELDLHDVRSHLALVLQEDFLFADTVRDNLLMGREGIAPDALEAALEISRVRTIVDRLPGGVEARVAERGATFSTGERQLLAIARALVGNPRFVILDEATASVDSETEAAIEQATRSLLRGRGALIVAHRLSTVRKADRILVVHRGSIRESGTHEQLLRTGGIYSRLHEIQFR